MSLTVIQKRVDFILKTPILRKIFVPASKFFISASNYRQMGLRLDDLLEEENPNMQKALHRLSADELYARNYRIMTAHQLSLSQSVLPDSKALKAEEDTAYLSPILLEVEAEELEKDQLNNMKVSRA
ncbi:hypothetical protein CANARDRAFT_28330 [[Candida] arabinofermentans NRRL YB-2248]|uniref:Cytochrome b-c1 complex subunit 7 n=1 Tax=[Candida] arabinofermentans NRRL YB-2248 TaxID=983967 RepID=A0A1E4T1E9_9ASCO|nr:hypothetical protein CANARDRAFT_28330 [[Candida] arabinofermentans NRRL YB-2248]